MRNGVIGVFVTASIALAPALSAHEGHAHKFMGTVTAVHVEKHHVEMKTTDGKTVGFHVTEATKYVRDKEPCSLADLKPGTRVVVTATQDANKKTTASEIRIGAAEKPTAKDSPRH
jgi:hypothetical protein